MNKVKYAMVVDQRRCVGCHTCEIACNSENKMPLDTKLLINTVIKDRRITDLPQNTQGIDYAFYARHEGPVMNYLTRSCQQCADAPCVKVCPENATWQNTEGIVEMDESRCINCAQCIKACPYEGMRVMTDTVKKCTFCVHRLYDDTLPAAARKPFCVAACPAGARCFGDVNDPTSEVSKALAKAKLAGRKIRSGVFPVKPGFKRTDSSVYFIAHDL